MASLDPTLCLAQRRRAQAPREANPCALPGGHCYGHERPKAARARRTSLRHLHTDWAPYRPRSREEPAGLARSRSAGPNVIFTTGKIFYRAFLGATGGCARPGLHPQAARAAERVLELPCDRSWAWARARAAPG